MSGRIIFLCTGNICRSPLAEALAAEMFAGLGLSFGSAGLDAASGLPASASSGEYAASRGLDLTEHLSQPISLGLLQSTTWMIGMTRSQAAIFRSRHGAAYTGRVGILGAPGVDLASSGRVAPGGHSPDVEEVNDPYGLTSDTYFACGDQISRLLQGWAPVFAAMNPARATDFAQEQTVMKIAIGSDHRGYAHKALISKTLRAQGIEVEDFGCHSEESADYPDAALPAAEMVARGDADAGILICGSGIGMSIAANKVKGIRASLCFTKNQARTTRQHNDSNMICLSGDAVDPQQALELTQVWLEADFEGGRHAGRVKKITDYEEKC